MTNPDQNTMEIINNQEVTLISKLKACITPNSEIAISTDYYTFNAVFLLVDELRQANSLKIIIDNKDFYEDLRFVYDSSELTSSLLLTSTYRLNKAFELLKDKADIRLSTTNGLKTIIVDNQVFLLTPCSLTEPTLGSIKDLKGYSIITLKDADSLYLKVFEEAWTNGSKRIKQEILDIYQTAVEYKSPEFIYKLTLNRIFENNNLDDIGEERLTTTGFKSTKVWDMLFNFQKDAVLGAIDKIETYNGCIIADSVGLGKTFEALAIIKYYELRNDRVLVLAPKKLRDNWTIYKQNDLRNILSTDRFNYDVLNHTDLTREGGLSGDINLKTINWGNYDLLVIDESHNFRNNPPKKDGTTRYQKLLQDVILSGVKTKVLLLSATPLNTRMNDIKNQIAFITEQKDDALAEYGISSIEQTLKRAQQQFNVWMGVGDRTNRNALVERLGGDYFKLLDLLTIARSRKYIEKYYDTADIGNFPKRLAPKSLKADFDTLNKFPAMSKVNETLNMLNLKFYSPLFFVLEHKKKDYAERYDTKKDNKVIFSQEAREDSIIHLMRVNLLKRLESSIHSFRLTLRSLLAQIQVLLSKVDGESLDDFYNEEYDITNLELDDTQLEDLMIGGKVKVLIQDIDIIKFREYLRDDEQRLRLLLTETEDINADRDAKLKMLREEITHKLKHPINNENRKVIVFSAFADTVKYLYENLADWLKTEFGVFSAQVTGGDANKTNLPKARADFNSILINFSPISKKRDAIYPSETKQIDILFCTDCISEGQNLQDCDYLINYDIHWNPVRIIQRFGRIDRIGSKNENIQLVNFFPKLDLDNYINLIGRVKGRMEILDISATGDDNVMEDENIPRKDLEYRKRQLEQLQESVVDLEDIDGGISITDLTLNDFKIDAERLTQEELSRYAMTPNAVFSLVKNSIEQGERGVLFCLKDLDEKGLDLKVSRNLIHPYSLCFISEEGDVKLSSGNPKRCLDYYKKLCSGQTAILPELIAEFNNSTKRTKYMSTYTELLDVAIEDIKGTVAEVGIDSLATPGGTLFSTTTVGKTHELISYLIIK